jgi:hypothetical protein
MIKKMLLIMFVLIFSPHLLFGQEVVVVLLKSKSCGPCRQLERVLADPAIQTTIAKNNVMFRSYEGEQWPRYLSKHNVTAYPTMLRFERNEQGLWVEKERSVGVKRLDFLLDFLGKRSIIQGLRR